MIEDKSIDIEGNSYCHIPSHGRVIIPYSMCQIFSIVRERERESERERQSQSERESENESEREEREERESK